MEYSREGEIPIHPFTKGIISRLVDVITLQIYNIVLNEYLLLFVFILLTL